jgi:hypothetical protein
MIDREGVRLVELGRRPTLRSMAGSTIAAKQPQVKLRGRMAGYAFLRRSSKHRSTGTLLVAILARHLHVRANQDESGFGVIEISGLPRFRCVATGAVLSKTPLMRILFRMTIVTICGR